MIIQPLQAVLSPKRIGHIHNSLLRPHISLMASFAADMRIDKQKQTMKSESHMHVMCVRLCISILKWCDAGAEKLLNEPTWFEVNIVSAIDLYLLFLLLLFSSVCVRASTTCIPPQTLHTFYRYFFPLTPFVVAKGAWRASHTPADALLILFSLSFHVSFVFVRFEWWKECVPSQCDFGRTPLRSRARVISRYTQNGHRVCWMRDK